MGSYHNTTTNGIIHKWNHISCFMSGFFHSVLCDSSMLLYIALVCLLSLLHSILLYYFVTSITYSSLGCFDFSAIMNKPAMNWKVRQIGTVQLMKLTRNRDEAEGTRASL